MKALIAMSGGVDSSVAAYLIKSQGCECIGCTMKLYGNEDIGSNSPCMFASNRVEQGFSLGDWFAKNSLELPTELWYN